MTWNVATNTAPVARKSYPCDACEAFHRVASRQDLIPAEQVIYDAAKADGFKVLRGMRYLKTSGFWEYEPSVFRARPDMDAICLRYDIYDD